MTIARKHRNPVRGAFTLMELMVVIAIIVVLAGIGGYAYMNSLESAKRDTAQATAKSILTPACKEYKLKVGNFPTQLSDLLQPTPDGYGPFLESEEPLLDPWNQQWRYDPAGPRNNGNAPDISTVTPNGIEIGNWPKNH